MSTRKLPSIGQKMTEDDVGGGFLGLLGLKKEAVLGLDGQAIMLKTDDFIGIRDIPNATTAATSSIVHLATVRSQPNATITVGVFFQGNLVRRYNPQTEEISSEPIDDLTLQNLLAQVAATTHSNVLTTTAQQQQQHQSIAPSRILPFDKIVSLQQHKQWTEQTCYVSSSRILKRRDIASGTKIIPGSFSDEVTTITTPSIQQSAQDGVSIRYPPIPVVPNDSTSSIRKVQHVGCKRYLATLSPSERTQLFVGHGDIAGKLLDDVLTKYYDSDWKELLGDLQLAYTLVLNLQCFASLEHWRDLIAMLSTVKPSGIEANASLYQNLIRILPAQLITIEKSFIEDIDQAGNNFLIPSLQTLSRNLSMARLSLHDDDNDKSLTNFQRLLRNQFPASFGVASEGRVSYEVVDENMQIAEHGTSSSMAWNHSDEEADDDEDGPVIVDADHVQASLARSAQANNPRSTLPFEIQSRYPVLVAAIQDHEDIVMTCARALDEKLDVSLVREAAAYLEETERRKF